MSLMISDSGDNRVDVYSIGIDGTALFDGMIIV